MKHLKKLFLILIIITLFMLIYSVVSPNVDVYTNSINLNSDYNIDYKVYNLFTNLTNKSSIIENNINSSNVGTYTIVINVKYLFFNVNKTVDINVIDNTKPIITLNGNTEVKVCPNTDYNEEGYTASDNYDGDITERVNIKKIDNSIIYSVIDSSSNETQVERKIIFEDDEAPKIELKGSADLNIFIGDNYNEEGYASYDKCDGDITNSVVVTSNLDTNKLGTYNIKYEAIDTSGNKAEVSRTIHVINKPSYYGNGIIYLTFDDGPSYLTGKILDILDSENIKATFFVTHGSDYVKRAYNSGNTIALHTYTHNYSYVYSSIDNYFIDLNNVSNSVYNSIGIHPKIIRFPGGSSNTISKNYSSGIMSRLTNEVINRGYTYFDWNVDSNDAGGDGYNSSKIYNNVISGLSHSKTNIVLMHDSESHSASVDALRNIIKYGKNNGYTFKAITSDTPIVRHGVNN